MRLLSCTKYAGRCPPGAVYIGRATPKTPASPLANPYIGESRAPKRCMHAVAVPDVSVLERYRRRLTRGIVEGLPVLAALRELRADELLACWCVERQAVLVGAGRPEPDQLCHGDVIFTVWRALGRLQWRVPEVSFFADYTGANRAWAELYEQAFGEPMIWGGASEAGKCSLPGVGERGAA